MSRPAPLLTLLIAAAVAAGAGAIWAQPWPPAPGTPAVSQPAPRTGGGIRWQKLTAEQKNALQPLAAQWPTLTGQQQRKWVAVTRNFQRLPPAEQATLQSRMTAWSTLTPAQRTQARLNYGEARRVPVTERKARWEQYQTLPSEERQRLAAGHPKPPHGMAPALRPTPRAKLARPVRTGENRPLPINENTLLPL
ncbi:MAG: DUF3106 domain-containing protein [Burkholderiaceae bacterium]|jgi:hypothetical protein|nr:DUF3106 domain-containing protein [Burkholderiaceae bacterium]